MEVVKTIVNTKKNLVGFWVEGTERDFGGLTQKKTVRPLSIEQIKQAKFSSKEIYVQNNNIVERGQFKISDLPMCVIRNGEYFDVPNTIELIARFLMGNDPVGFTARFGDGDVLDITYDNIVQLSKWYKPVNFIIRKSSTSKSFISGKKGFKLEELETKQMATNYQKTKRLKSKATKIDSAVDTLSNNIDILDIFEFVKGCNGVIINLPGEKYQATVDTNVKTADNFIPLGIGEIAQPYPEFNPNKLNVNANFKKVGAVKVTLNSDVLNVTSFNYSKKSIFYGGENHIKHLGVAVPKDMEERFVKTLGTSLALSQIKDVKVIQPLSDAIASESGISFYKINTDKIDVMSKEKMKESIMSSSEIADASLNMYRLKLMSKYFSSRGSVIKELKSQLSEEEIVKASDKKLFGMFKMMSPEGIEVCKNAGIDVYTGAFIGTQLVSGDDSKSKAGSKEKKEEVSIEYILDSYNAAKISGSDIQAKQIAGTLEELGLTQKQIAVINNFNKMETPYEKYKYALSLQRQIDTMLSKYNELFWKHNVSMYVLGNGTIHTQDRDKWEIDSKAKGKATTFRNKEIQLSVKFTGANM